MKKSIITLFFSLFFSLAIFAQNEVEFTSAAYGNLRFDLPVGMTENREKGYMATSPEGLYGVSITQFNSNAFNKKNSTNMIKDLARAYKMEKPHIMQVKYADANGMQASGKVDGKNMDIVLLSSWGKVSQIVVIYDDQYKEDAKRFFQSLSKI